MADRRTPRAAASTAAEPTNDPPLTWWRFTGPYPVVLMDRGLEVAVGDVVPGPVPGGPDWEPTKAPDPEES